MSVRHQADPRNAKRQRLVAHLHECGARPTLEALLAVAAGNDLDQVLEDFSRLSAETYHRVGADRLPVKRELVLKGDES
jgi:hypothetical protein